VGIPDLRSRLAASPVAEIGPPDDALMQALLERQFLRRGLDARPELIQWLLARLERSFIAVERAVDALDQEVLERRKRLSIPLARGTLAEAGIISRPSATDDDRRG
jgi:chromosomal replication initiation ATPase DnaA